MKNENGTPAVVQFENGRWGYTQSNGQVVGSYLDADEAAEVAAHYASECRADGSTPITHLEAARMLLAQAECSIREPFAPLPALAAFDALTAKAAALDALVEAAMVLVQHAQEAYPHFEYTRGQADIAATLAALSAAKLAQAQS